MSVRLPRAALLVFGLVFGCVCASAAVAHAHTEVQRSTPSPGAEVRGVVDRVELVFLDPVQPSVTIAVSSLEGVRVEGLGDARLDDGRRVARVEFTPLRAPGPFLVEYDWVAEDGAAQRGSFTFRYLGATTDDGGFGSAGAVALFGFVALIVAAAVVARRRATPARSVSSDVTRRSG